MCESLALDIVYGFAKPTFEVHWTVGIPDADIIRRELRAKFPAAQCEPRVIMRAIGFRDQELSVNRPCR